MICSVENIREIRQIANNINNERIEPFIEEVERIFVMPALGVELYKKIDETPGEYIEVLEGGYYDGDRRYFSGLRRAIGYMVQARFMRDQSMNVTAFGMVLKNGQLSERASDASIARICSEAQGVGEKYLAETVAYCKFVGLIETHKKSTFSNKLRVIGD